MCLKSAQLNENETEGLLLNECQSPGRIAGKKPTDFR